MIRHSISVSEVPGTCTPALVSCPPVRNGSEASIKSCQQRTLTLTHPFSALLPRATRTPALLNQRVDHPGRPPQRFLRPRSLYGQRQCCAVARPNTCKPPHLYASISPSHSVIRILPSDKPRPSEPTSPESHGFFRIGELDRGTIVLWRWHPKAVMHAPWTTDDLPFKTHHSFAQ
ncbi:hypothetical protein CTheo_2134 [Ceratobasidium theobromae]|uniref:Uncharacterized protein n=1 Tax=Ceratobasidium theobromae TaxID=1582974 RepID=A0A5N5QT05_9AGAM|nr:hypothetical protein CTheo_2134 [Ceratobasidium theobromae]